MILRILVFDPFMISVFGFPRFGWLRALVAVACSFKRSLSRTWKNLNRPRSTFTKPGPTITPGELLPRVPTAGMAKAAARIQELAAL